jgi:hypothetical protein
VIWGEVENPKSEVYQPLAGTKSETMSKIPNSNDENLGVPPFFFEHWNL